MSRNWALWLAGTAGVLGLAAWGTAWLFSGDAEFREQPELLEVERGEEWRLLVANDGLGMPAPEEAVLAIRIGSGPVDVLDREGRVAMRIETAGTPMAVINEKKGLMVVSDQDWHGAWTRLLVIDMETPGVLQEIPLDGRRVSYSIFYGGGIEASEDGRWVYWIEHEWNGERWEYGVRAVALDSGEAADWHMPVPAECGWPELRVHEGSAIALGCNGQWTPADAQRTDAEFGGQGAALRGDDYRLKLDWARDGGSVTLRMVDPITGHVATEKQLAGTVDAYLLDTRRALVLRTDGTLERMDVWTAETEALQHRLEGPFHAGDIALTR